MTSLADVRKNMTTMTPSLEQEAAKVGLQISGNKTEVMRISYVMTQDPIVVGYQPLEEVNQITFASDRDADHDVVCQIAKAGALFGRSGRTQRSIWRGRLICSIIIPN